MTSGSLFRYIWGEVLVIHSLSLRFLGWIFSIIAILLPYFILQHSKLFQKHLLFIVWHFLLGYGSYNEFSPGSSTICLFQYW